MRLEAIAALSGHRSMELALTRARITARVVADECEAVTAQIDALYNTAATPGALPAEIATAAMTLPPPRSPRPGARQRLLHTTSRTRMTHGISL